MILRLLPLCVVVLLSACASLPPPAVPPGDLLRGVSPAPTSVDGGFSIEGRLSVRRGDTRHHVGISWRHEAAHDEIFLSGPLGQGLAELSRDASGAQLLTADRQLIRAADWESLAERAFGARLPLSGLPRWLAGVPAEPTIHIDGWRIDILEVVDGRPALIELQRDDIEARLKIDSWAR